MPLRHKRIQGNFLASRQFNYNGTGFADIFEVRSPRFRCVAKESDLRDGSFHFDIFSYFYASSGVVYFVDGGHTPHVAFTDKALNPVLRHLDEAWKAFGEIDSRTGEGNYYFAQKELEDILGDTRTCVFDLTKLDLPMRDPRRNLTCLDVGVTLERYTQLAQEQLRLAKVGVVGSDLSDTRTSYWDTFFTAYMSTLTNTRFRAMAMDIGDTIGDIPFVEYFKVMLLSPEYVLQQAKDRAFARVCSLRFDYLDATGWGLGDTHYMDGFVDEVD